MIDKALVKETVLASFKKSNEDIEFMQKVLGREMFYRLIMNYPKKWSRRKVKKKGSRDFDLVKLEYGIQKMVEKVHSLGPEYEHLFMEETTEE